MAWNVHCWPSGAISPARLTHNVAAAAVIAVGNTASNLDNHGEAVAATFVDSGLLMSFFYAFYHAPAVCGGSGSGRESPPPRSMSFAYVNRLPASLLITCRKRPWSLSFRSLNRNHSASFFSLLPEQIMPFESINGQIYAG